LWSALTSNPNFAAPTGPFKPGPNCIINLSVPGFVPPKTAQAADRPAIRIGEAKVAYTRQRNSKAVALAFGYPIQVNSAQYGVDTANPQRPGIGLLNSIILQALDAAGINLGNSSVYKWELATGNSSVGNDLAMPKGQPVWNSLLTINIIFWMLNADFRNVTFT
jgi:hypothetical protein